MNNNRIRLTESQLHRVIKESVRRVLNEGKPIDLSYYKQSPNQRMQAARELLLQFGSVERIPQMARNEYWEELSHLQQFY